LFRRDEVAALFSRYHNMTCQRKLCALLAFPLVLATGASQLRAQVKAPAEHLKEHDAEIEKLRSDVKKLKKEVEDLKGTEEKKPADTKGDETKGLFANGILTLGGVKLKLGGKAEILFIDSQSEHDSIVGSTEAPDPRFDIDKLRLAPVVYFPNGFSLHAEIDFKPSQGSVILKEMFARHDLEPEWWFRSRLSLGLDDRFIRPSRITKNYPLIGNAFWRKESVAMTWGLRIGDKGGEPQKKKGGKKGADGTGAEASDTVAEDAEGQPVDIEAGSPREPDAAFQEKSKKHHEAFNFGRNPGELQTYFSFGDGNTLNNKQVGFDGAPFNDLIQDDRDFAGDISIREVGVGLGYAREFGWLGEASLLGFYYYDQLNDASVEFLQQEVTIRDPVTGAPIAGYGDSNHHSAYRYGIGGEYFFPASTFLGPDWKPKGQDGFRVSGQWIKARDGDLKRDGWYAQGSYKFSFPHRLLFEKYFRSVEPLVRYGVLNTGLSPTPLLPTLWDRSQLLVGLVVEVVPDVLIKAEYTFNDEDTGSGPTSPGPSSVSNNELLVELLLKF
jgi:hypothetical protein